MQRLRFSLLTILFLSALQFAAQAQVSSNSRLNSQEAKSPHGVIVESVDKDSEGEKLGIRPGDLISGWVRADQHGAIDSPFDFSWVEIEQKPRGPLSLEGEHNGEKRSWKFVTDQFGVTVRPIMREKLLNGYKEAAALVKAEKVSDAAATWKRLAHETRLNDPNWLASWLLMHAGQALSGTAAVRDGGQYFEEADRLTPENETYARILIKFLCAFWNQEAGDLDKGAALYASAVELASQDGEQSLTVARGLEGIGLAAFYHDDLATAREYLQRSLTLRRQLAPASSAEASSLVWLAGVDRKTGDLSSAQSLVERADEIDQKLAPHSLEMAQISTALGQLAFRRGDQEQAEMYYTRALTLDQKYAGHRPLAAAAMLVNLGGVAWARGDFVAAERYYRESAAIADEMGPQSGVAAVAHNNLGLALIDEERLDEAETQLQRAMEIHTKRKAANIRKADTLEQLGRLAYRRNNTSLAEEYLQQTADIQRRVAPKGRDLADTLSDLGSIFLKTGELGKAEKCLLEAMEIHEKVGPQSAAYGDDLASLASLRFREGKTAEASASYKKAIDVQENQMARLGGGSEVRSIYRLQIADYYRDYISILVEHGEIEAALDVLERSRARALLELLDNAHADIRKGVDSALLAQQQSLSVDISGKSELRAGLLEDHKPAAALKASNEEINKLVTQYQDLQSKIRSANPDYAALVQPQSLTPQAIRRQLLDPKTVLLEYSLGEHRSYVFAITAESIRAFSLPPNAEIQAASIRLHSLLSAHPAPSLASTKHTENSTPQSDLVRSAKSLSDMVLKPVAAQIAGKRVVIVADGALQYIPFSMLPDPVGDGAADHVLEPLVVDHEIVNLPSASVLAALRRQAATRPRLPKLVAVLADPVFSKDDSRVTSRVADSSNRVANETKASTDRSAALDVDLLTRSAQDLGLSRGGEISLPRLPYTRLEAEAIRAVTSAPARFAALDFDASRATVISGQLSDFRIVHFATHALANSEHPELSGLVFSLVDRNGNSQDGFLRLKDIYNLNLRADLVVLSACETGLGKVIKGEGLIGLTRGFMYAGASRVVASLWNVSDVATAQLMTNFYRGMEHDHLAPAAALRQAQIAMWKQKRWSSPYFWAAFQIQGDWK